MEHYTLKRWEASELFVKIVAKYETKSNQHVEENLTKYLKRYERAKVSYDVATEILKPIADNVFGLTNYYPNFLSDLSKEVNSGIPFPRTKTRLLLMLEYIGEAKQLERYETISSQGQKHDAFVGSYWWIYSHKVYSDEITKEKKLLINRDVLSLGEFNYAELATMNTHNNELIGQQNYNGSYYLKDNRYLIMDLRVAKTKDKELRIIIDIGSANMSIGNVFTGYYLNASNNLYFGPALLERIGDKDDLASNIFTDYDSNVETAIWQFYDGLASVPNKLIPSYGAKGRLNNFLKPQ